MNLNKEFKQAIIDNQYYYSAFDGKIHDINDLQVCHILSKSKRTLNSIKKAYGCSEKTAEILMNMPLLNTVIGTRKDNAEYKKTDDIVYIDAKICQIVYLGFAYKYINNNFNISSFNKLVVFLDNLFLDPLAMAIALDYKKDIFSGIIKDIQYQFHKEIDLHI